ncbi:MAG: CDGSH iron-sulfur domain-containing protein [Sutterellaceae bacterium]|nr:CDGSH iron-sulfur domain-containing protein [Burkholderiaceae bacterium]MDW8429671.1 CDGSH iron-sulfur domain-containing protein [Sutterellaceae bacterium]
MSVNHVAIRANGPYVCTGRIIVCNDAGSVLRAGAQVAWCRCGASNDKPFCDGSHNRVGFTDAGGCAKPEAGAVSGDGPLRVTVKKDGPLFLEGLVQVQAADGSTAFSGDKTWLCRCGQSQNKPFCDGTHKKVGFTG